MAGQGYRKCNCGKLIHVRAKCECGYVFAKKAKVEVTKPIQVNKPKETEQKTLYRNGLAPIITPSGSPPVKLTDVSYEGVQRWAGDVVKHGMSNGKNYTPDAVVYFLRSFVGINSPEFGELSQACHELVA